MGGGLRGWPWSTPVGSCVDQGWASGDEELSEFPAAHDRDGAVVAPDAPLEVTNPAGTRRAAPAARRAGLRVVVEALRGQG